MQTLQKCIMQYKYNCKACNYWEVKGSSYFLWSGNPTGIVRHEMKEQHFFASRQKELVPFIRGALFLIVCAVD